MHKKSGGHSHLGKDPKGKHHHPEYIEKKKGKGKKRLTFCLCVTGKPRKTKKKRIKRK